MEKIRNIAVMAHVDAGKTTLTERMLFESGTSHTLGSVDKGTAKTDDLSVERKRGISVRSVLTSLNYRDTAINIIDTPGHADFISQTERAFFAVDGVIVLVSAVDGVQTNTEILLDTVKKLKMPCIVFINKTDRDIANPKLVTQEIKEIFSAATPIDEIFETLAENDEECLSMYLEGKEPTKEFLNKKISECTAKSLIAPILCGSAIKGDGVKELLDAIVDYLPMPKSAGSETGGVVYTVTHDKAFGRAAYVRLFSGSLAVKQSVICNNTEYKINMIKKPVLGKMTDFQTLNAGEVGAVFGPNGSKTGEIIGNSDFVPQNLKVGDIGQALLMTAVTANDGTDVLKLKACLEQLAAEEPLMDLIWEPISKTLNIKVFGNIQTEILKDIIAERFGIDVSFGSPVVIYKETPTKAGFGFDAYTMPKPCWAVVKFKITPLERGSGLVYKCSAPPNRLSYRYRKQVEESIKASTAQGAKGWELTDAEIDLVDGEDHPIHTHPLDFTIATPLAIADGLRNTGTTLLEPYIHARFTCSDEHYGRLMSDIIRMRGEATPPMHRKTTIVLEAEIPVATSLDYPAVFASYTSGRGIMSAVFCGYRVCPDELGKTMERRGVDPLDRSKYILAARHAMSGTVFDVN